MPPDPAGAAIGDQPPSLRDQLAHRWQRVKIPLYILSCLMGMILLAILVFRRDLISSRALSLMVNVGLLIYLSVQLVKASRWVRSMPVSPWIVRLALVCIYAFFLGLMGASLAGLLLVLGIFSDALSFAFDLSLLLAGAGMALGLISLVVFGIVGAVRWEMRVSAEERRVQELRSNEP